MRWHTFASRSRVLFQVASERRAVRPLPNLNGTAPAPRANVVEDVFAPQGRAAKGLPQPKPARRSGSQETFDGFGDSSTDEVPSWAAPIATQPTAGTRQPPGSSGHVSVAISADGKCKTCGAPVPDKSDAAFCPTCGTVNVDSKGVCPPALAIAATAFGVSLARVHAARLAVAV